ncbi:hypothetical protein [Methylobacterium sp. CM6246]
MINDKGHALDEPVISTPDDETDFINFLVSYSHIIDNIDDDGTNIYTIRMRGMGGIFRDYSRPYPDLEEARKTLAAHRMEMCVAFVFSLGRYREEAFKQRVEDARLYQEEMSGQDPQP